MNDDDSTIAAVGVKKGSLYDTGACRWRHGSGVESSQQQQQQQQGCGAVRRYVVIGGGIAGVSCAQELQRLLYTSCCSGENILVAAESSVDIVLISLTDHLTEATSIFKVTHHLEEFTVYERSADKFCFANPHIRVLRDRVLDVDCDRHIIHLAGLNNDPSSSSSSPSPYTLSYDKLCICSGVRSKLIQSHPRVIGIRDSTSVDELVRRLETARTVVVIGNGGIALELIDQLTFCDVHWIVRDRYIGSAFFDASAAAFVMPVLKERSHVTTRVDAASILVDAADDDDDDDAMDTSCYAQNDCNIGACFVGRAQTLSATASSLEDASRRDGCASLITSLSHQTDHLMCGYGLGPEWMSKTAFKSVVAEKLGTRGSGDGKNHLTIHYEQEVVEVVADRDDDDDDDDDDAHLCGISSTERSSVDSSASSSNRPMRIRTTSGAIIECDFVVSATGVVPNTNFLSHSDSYRGLDSGSSKSSIPMSSNSNNLNIIHLDEKGYISVDHTLACPSIADRSVYAAGDCCSYPSMHPLCVDSERAVAHPSPDGHFFQMRLWTQARLMGQYSAQAMLDRHEEYGLDAHFEIFTHITRFFGYKVVLLGRYNAQGLGGAVEALTRQIVVTNNDRGSKSVVDDQSKTSSSAVELWVRIIPGQQYIKLVVFHGKVVGALLLGDTDLEEVFENLILNRLDVGGIGITLLDPDVDIGDYFD